VFEFLTANAIYVVLIISLVVWLGIYLYLRGIEKKLKGLEERLLKKS